MIGLMGTQVVGWKPTNSIFQEIKDNNSIQDQVQYYTKIHLLWSLTMCINFLDKTQVDKH